MPEIPVSNGAMSYEGRLEILFTHALDATWGMTVMGVTHEGDSRLDAIESAPPRKPRLPGRAFPGYTFVAPFLEKDLSAWAHDVLGKTIRIGRFADTGRCTNPALKGPSRLREMLRCGECAS
jgi:hypothetical protein